MTGTIIDLLPAVSQIKSAHTLSLLSAISLGLSTVLAGL